MLNMMKGNLIDLAEAGHFDIIVHGCNCQNTMGSGIAKEIKERYPQAYEIDTAYHKKLMFEVEKLGNYTEAFIEEPIIGSSHQFRIINAYTQVGYLPRGIDHFEYESFRLILRKLAFIYPKKRFGFPYIGMGLAGGDSKRIISMLEEFATDIAESGSSATLVEFKG